MEGYAKLAALMGAHPQVAILRRFGALNAQNLLYLQAELTLLESDLQHFSAEDSTSHDPDRSLYSRDWYGLSISNDGANRDESAGTQWRIVLKIRDKLKEYSESEEVCHTQQRTPLKESQTRRSSIKRPSQTSVLQAPTISPSSKNGWSARRWEMSTFSAKMATSGLSPTCWISLLWALKISMIRLRRL